MRTMAERFKRATSITLPVDMVESASLISSLMDWSSSTNIGDVKSSADGYLLCKLPSNYRLNVDIEPLCRKEWDSILYWVNESMLFLSWQWLSLKSVGVKDGKSFVVVQMTIRAKYLF